MRPSSSTSNAYDDRLPYFPHDSSCIYVNQYFMQVFSSPNINYTDQKDKWFIKVIFSHCISDFYFVTIVWILTWKCGNNIKFETWKSELNIHKIKVSIQLSQGFPNAPSSPITLLKLYQWIIPESCPAPCSSSTGTPSGLYLHRNTAWSPPPSDTTYRLSCVNRTLVTWAECPTYFLNFAPIWRR